MRSSSKIRVRYWHVVGRASRPRLAHPGPTPVAFPRYVSEPPSTGTRARGRRSRCQGQAFRGRTQHHRRYADDRLYMECAPRRWSSAVVLPDYRRSSRRGSPGCHSSTRPAVSLARLICARSIGIPARRFRASFHQCHVAWCSPNATVRRSNRSAALVGAAHHKCKLAACTTQPNGEC